MLFGIVAEAPSLTIIPVLKLYAHLLGNTQTKIISIRREHPHFGILAFLVAAWVAWEFAVDG